MKKVILRRMVLDNFKCFSHFEVDFNDTLTSFAGNNGTGKTTLYDAYSWVTTGADSNGCAVFKVQPILNDSTFIPKVDTKVKAEFLVDGTSFVLERELSQIWTKPRGSSEEVFKGTESTYYIDSVPMAMKDYYARIAEVFCPASDMRLLSSVFNFFSLSKEDKRRKLMEMAGQLPDILTPDRFPNLYREYLVTKSVSGVKTKAQYALKELKARQQAIPSRKSENERNLPTGIDFGGLKNEKQEIELQIASIDAQLQKSSEAGEAAYRATQSINKQLADVTASLSEMDGKFLRMIADSRAGVDSKIAEIDTKLSQQQSQKRMLKLSLEELTMTLERYEAKRQELLRQWQEVRASQLTQTMDSTCPTCGKPYTREEMEKTWNTMLQSFNEGKVNTLRTINNEGSSYKELIEKTKTHMDTQRTALEAAEAAIVKLELEKEKASAGYSKVPDLNALKSGSAEYMELMNRRGELMQMLRAGSGAPSAEDFALKSRKAELGRRLEEVIRQLVKQDMISVVENRRRELDEEAAQIAVDIAKQDQLIYEYKEYTKTHISMVEDTVSGMFTMIRFQMYENNVSNDGEKEMCECLVNGVPYSTNVNAAARINAGVDFINALSLSMGVSLPLWVDNKESVVNLIPTDAQVITLAVDGNNSIITKL